MIFLSLIVAPHGARCAARGSSLLGLSAITVAQCLLVLNGFVAEEDAGDTHETEDRI